MQAILFDLDGVLYQGDTLLPGAAETVAWARAECIPHLFLTNTSSRPRAAIAEKLAQLGIEVAAEQILAPPAAACTWLRAEGIEDIALFAPAATAVDFAGLNLLPANAERGAGAVVVGDLAEGWDFRTLNRAFRLLVAKPAPRLLALGMTRYWHAAGGLQLDAGPFVAALQYASGIEPVVLGKPAAAFFDTGVAAVGSLPARTLMIGDDIRGDVAGAQRAGLKAALVRTGKFRPADLHGDVRPDAVFDTVGHLPAWWQRHAG
ncbi:MAG: TIGR01458 family HAD-type hydrolase [Thiohalocapsa sp.]|jgi:HAD superfamily hydrolase (TIGR01458 family)|uniref:TIGR01458 family HAD-type hydrolase n=1 Tax=Thiohalocapsa sp. TaxID=2497641 RepID=UPI0025E34D50|nr:TIGR01458 family HAD-type hydrolase [Thiohalocapsa sp.]MCG6941804.1 TIGR01458 family HAD-type hydrolase [Thiohalocapsa sp.]